MLYPIDNVLCNWYIKTMENTNTNTTATVVTATDVLKLAMPILAEIDEQTVAINRLREIGYADSSEMTDRIQWRAEEAAKFESELFSEDNMDEDALEAISLIWQLVGDYVV